MLSYLWSRLVDYVVLLLLPSFLCHVASSVTLFNLNRFLPNILSELVFGLLSYIVPTAPGRTNSCHLYGVIRWVSISVVFGVGTTLMPRHCWLLSHYPNPVAIQYCGVTNCYTGGLARYFVFFIVIRRRRFYGGTGHKFCRFHKEGLLPSPPEQPTKLMPCTSVAS